MLSELLCSEFPNGLEHREPLPVAIDQALVDQRLEIIDVCLADSLGGVEGAAPVEDR